MGYPRTKLALLSAMIGCGPAVIVAVASMAIFAAWMFTADGPRGIGSGEAFGVLLLGGAPLAGLVGGTVAYVGFVTLYGIRIWTLEPDARIQRYVIELLAVGALCLLVVVATMIVLSLA